MPTTAKQTETVPVTIDNFNRAESDKYFRQCVTRSGAIGKFNHARDLDSIEHPGVIRANRDTLYSAAVFDLDAGPVAITLPEPAGRFMSLIAIDEDQYAVTTAYAPGSFTFTREQVGTRYVMIGIRTFVNPNDPADMERVHALQNGVKADQKGTGSFDVPNWDPVSEKAVRDALIVLAGTIPDTKGMYGPRSKVDPLRHLIGTATGWGANAPEDAIYIPVVPVKNDGKTVHRLTIRGEVPVDGFWSISVYGADGYFHKNDQNAYTLNNVTAKKAADGSVTIQFGGCDGKVPNCIPIEPGWNYWVRLYRPRAEVFSGSFVFPEAKPVGEKGAGTTPVRDAETGKESQARA